MPEQVAEAAGVGRDEVGGVALLDVLAEHQHPDLVVDVLLRPSGETIVLDEEDLPPDLAPELRIHIARALEAIAAAIARILRRRQSGDLAGARREVDIASVNPSGSST